MTGVKKCCQSEYLLFIETSSDDDFHLRMDGVVVAGGEPDLQVVVVDLEKGCQIPLD